MAVEFTKAEKTFIDQITRRRLVDCADWLIQEKNAGSDQGFPPDHLPDPYKEHALERGWLSKRDHGKLTGKGFGVAASFLKR